MTAEPARPLGRRLASWGWDYLVVVGWLLLVLLVVGVPQLAGWWDLSAIWIRPAAAEAAVALLTVVPYLAYLVLTEAGPAAATWGKRRVGLAVHGPGGPGRPAAGWRVALRNLVKVVPWQLGHMSALRFASAETVTGVALGLFAASLGLLAAIVVPVLMGSRGLHDLLAGTAVGHAPA